MELLVPILIQLIAGGADGNVIGQLAKSVDLGMLGNSVVGAVGGFGATWLAGMIPGLDTLVGAATGVAGTLDTGALAGQGAVGLVGGGLLTAIAGILKSTMAKA